MSAAEMSDRSSGRVVSLPAPSHAKGGGGPFNGNDSLSAPAAVRRVGAAWAEQVIRGLTPLKLAIVEGLARTRLATGHQLQRLHFEPSPSSQRQARRVLASLVERRVLARLGRTIGGRRAGSAGFVYSLDVVGKRIINPDGQWRRPWTSSLAFVAHAVAVTECYVGLVEGERQGRWRLLDFQAEPLCWRSFVGPRGLQLVLKPDAYVGVEVDGYEDRWFLEIDRATEDLGRIQRKARTYVSYWQVGREAVFPRVLWVTTRQAREAALVSALAALPADHWQLFQVCLTEDFAATIGAGAGATEVEPDSQEGR